MMTSYWVDVDMVKMQGLVLQSNIHSKKREPRFPVRGGLLILAVATSGGGGVLELVTESGWLACGGCG